MSKVLKVFKVLWTVKLTVQKNMRFLIEIKLSKNIIDLK